MFDNSGLTETDMKKYMSSVNKLKKSILEAKNKLKRA